MGATMAIKALILMIGCVHIGWAWGQYAYMTKMPKWRLVVITSGLGATLGYGMFLS